MLNFGLPSPIDIRIDGRDIHGNRDVAISILNEVRQVPGIVDARIQQEFDYPDFEVAVDRTKALQGGLHRGRRRDSVLNTLSGSFQTAPMFFLNRPNGVNYTLVAQTPQYSVQSLQELAEHSGYGPARRESRGPRRCRDDQAIAGDGGGRSLQHSPRHRHLRDRAGPRPWCRRAPRSRRSSMLTRNCCRAAASSRSAASSRRCAASYINLLAGLAFSIVLVYLLIVVNFQSWLDPFIIIMALPAALGGIVLFLFFTHTTLSVPALMGAIMCMGVATANSILVVSFARERLAEHGDAVRAAIEAGFTRFRPVLMTALAMIIGMIPMALGLGEGGEQNAPLGRAVIGGLMLATVATLVFVPTLFALLHNRKHRPPPCRPGARASSGMMPHWRVR